MGDKNMDDEYRIRESNIRFHERYQEKREEKHNREE